MSFFIFSICSSLTDGTTTGRFSLAYFKFSISFSIKVSLFYNYS